MCRTNQVIITTEELVLIQMVQTVVMRGSLETQVILKWTIMLNLTILPILLVKRGPQAFGFDQKQQKAQFPLEEEQAQATYELTLMELQAVLASEIQAEIQNQQ